MMSAFNSPARGGLGQFLVAAAATVPRQVVKFGPGDWLDTGGPRTTNSRCTAIGPVPRVLAPPALTPHCTPRAVAGTTSGSGRRGAPGRGGRASRLLGGAAL